MTDLQEAIDNLAEAAWQFDIALVDAISKAALTCCEIMANWLLSGMNMHFTFFQFP